MHTQLTVRGNNAMAFGFPGFSAILVGKKLRDNCTADELNGILAHEWTHIRQCHMPIKIVAMIGIRKLTAKKFDAAIKREEQKMLAALPNHEPEAARKIKVLRVAKVAFPIVAMNTVTYITEYLADEGARKAGLGVPMANALLRICPDEKWWAALPITVTQQQIHSRSSVRMRRMAR